ncbi:MAG: hypothetical protein ACE5LC_00275 [Candidatus Aminicenantales bacterium]
MKRIVLNLATHPFRNRRLFFLLTGVMVVVIALFSFLALHTYLTYRDKVGQVRLRMEELEAKVRVAQRSEQEFMRRIEEETKLYKGTVDLVNSIILRKSFSWTEFLASLENSLPDSSYIVSLAPILIGGSSMEVRFKVVSRNLRELLKLIDNLRALKFKVRVEGESRDESGSLISEISLRYERNV